MANFNPAHKAVLDDLPLGNALACAGKMFGFPIAAQQEASVA